MYKIILALILSIGLSSNAHALIDSVVEEDGTPQVWPYQLKIPNGGLTDNSDGTASLDFSGGGGGTGYEWTDTGSVIHPSEDTTDNVAIGGTDSTAKIYLQTDGTAHFGDTASNGNVTIDKGDAFEGALEFDNGGADSVKIRLDSSENFYIEHKTANADLNIDMTDGSGAYNLMFFDGSAKRVGINDNTPSAMLDVATPLSTESGHTVLITGGSSQTGDLLRIVGGILGTGDLINIQDASASVVFSMDENGKTLFQNGTDFTDCFQIADADGGNPVLDVDCTNERIGIGTSPPDTTLHINGGADGAVWTSASNSSLGNILIADDDSTGTSDSIAGAISFAGSSHDFFQRAAIVGRQSNGSADADRFGLEFYSHPSATGSAALELVFSIVPSSVGNREFTISDGTEVFMDTDTFFLDADSDEIGIQTSTPSATLDVGGGSTTTIDGTDDILVKDDIEVDGDIYGEGKIVIKNASDSTTSYQFLDADGGNPIINVDSTNERVSFGTATPSTSIVTVIPSTTTDEGIRITGLAAQTADLLAVENDMSTKMFQVKEDGAVLSKNDTDSTTAFEVQDSSGSSILDVDTTNKAVIIGGTGQQNDSAITVQDADTSAGLYANVLLAETSNGNDIMRFVNANPGSATFPIGRIELWRGTGVNVQLSADSTPYIRAEGNFGIHVGGFGEDHRFESDGDVAFGDTTAGASLDVKTGGTGQTTLQIQAASGETSSDVFQVDGDGDSSFDEFVIQYDGDVGIQQTSPSTELHIGGTSPAITVGDGDAEDNIIYFDDSANDQWMGYYSSSMYWGIGNGSSVGINPRIIMDTSGNIGINNTSASRNLHITDTMRLEPRSSAPTSPSSGDLYIDSTPSPDAMCFYNGTDWDRINAGGTDADCT